MRYIFFKFLSMFFPVKEVFSGKKIFQSKTFFPYKNIVFCKLCIICKKHKYFSKKTFVNLVLQQMKHHMRSNAKNANNCLNVHERVKLVESSKS